MLTENIYVLLSLLFELFLIGLLYPKSIYSVPDTFPYCVKENTVESGKDIGTYT